jgi:hypothetical protein
MRRTHADLREVTVDRIALLIRRLYREEAGRTISALHNLRAIGQARTWTTDYHTKSEIPLSPTVSIFAEVGYTTGQTYFKVDWKPQELGAIEWRALLVLLEGRFGLTFESLLRRGLVTYLEIAADFEGVDTGDILVFHRTLKSGSRVDVHPKLTHLEG